VSAILFLPCIFAEIIFALFVDGLHGSKAIVFKGLLQLRCEIPLTHRAAHDRNNRIFEPLHESDSNWKRNCIMTSSSFSFLVIDVCGQSILQRRNHNMEPKGGHMNPILSGTTEQTAQKLGAHPCFNQEARHTHARIHLPVAPRCNMQCNYCNRKYSCVNESRPGVTCAILTPGQSIEYLRKYTDKVSNLSVVGIAGPGDPFANASETLETLRMVKVRHPHLLLCIASNGLNLFPYVDELAAIGLSHVTVTVNAVDPRIGAKFYEWMAIDGHRCEGVEAAEQLWDRQRKAIRALAAKGGVVHINYFEGFLDSDFQQRLAALKAEEAQQDAIDDSTPKFGDRSHNGPAVRQINAARLEKLGRIPLSKLLDHFEHAVKVAGIDHVGLGSDFDGVDDMLPEGMEDISRMPNLVGGLMERGFSDDDILKILGGNTLRVMRQVEQVAKSAPR